MIRLLIMLYFAVNLGDSLDVGFESESFGE